MSKTSKLHVILAKTDHLQKTFGEMLSDYVKFFQSKQSAFRGELKTYTPSPGTIDIPSERGNKLVVTTVSEKLDWFSSQATEYFDSLLAQEATNASGTVKAHLVVDGEDWGEFSSLELLRLKSLLETTNLVTMYSTIPVRNDDENWYACNHEMYKDRDVYESILMSGEKKSTVKEQYVLQDPNLASLKDSSGYKPQISTKDTIITLGSYTFQKFSGELSHRERAEILKRRSTLLNAVIVALKEANDAEVIQSNLKAEKIFKYLHQGK